MSSTRVDTKWCTLKTFYLSYNDTDDISTRGIIITLFTSLNTVILLFQGKPALCNNDCLFSKSYCIKIYMRAISLRPDNHPPEYYILLCRFGFLFAAKRLYKRAFPSLRLSVRRERFCSSACAKVLWPCIRPCSFFPPSFALT